MLHGTDTMLLPPIKYWDVGSLPFFHWRVRILTAIVRYDYTSVFTLLLLLFPLTAVNNTIKTKSIAGSTGDLWICFFLSILVFLQLLSCNPTKTRCVINTVKKDKLTWNVFITNTYTIDRL